MIPPPSPERFREAMGASPVSARSAHYLYRASLEDFLRDVLQGRLVPLLEERFDELEHHAVDGSELDAWKNSLPQLALVLSDARFVGQHIFVELRMPLNGRRCDALLTGRSEGDEATAVVVELKQWQQVKRSAIAEDVAIGTKTRQHPSAQVRDYVGYLRHYHSAFVHEGVRAVGCAFLHDMTHAPSIEILRDAATFGSLPIDYPLFTRTQREAMASWLLVHLGGGDGAVVADAVARGGPCVSTMVLDMVSDVIRGEREWQLIDEQRQAYMRVITAVELAKANGEKSVVIVRGGPGTGKSVIAIQLLAHAAAKGWRVVHASGTQAFQKNLQGKTEKLAGDILKRVFSVKTKSALPVKDLFCTFADIASQGEENVLDLVVADEAHRLWKRRLKTIGPGRRIEIPGVAPMVEEMIRASRVTAFFLDDNQSVRAEEIGRAQVIKEHARAMGVKIHEVDLNLQFRCNGSESYVRWVDALFGFDARVDLAWRRYEGYTLHVDATMEELVTRFETHRRAGARCRLVAGFCWGWSDPIGSTLVKDIKDPRLGSWEGAWIERSDQSLPPQQHRYYRWANEDACFEQVGSIYSVQGFEFDHVGVIWGDDLVWRDGAWRADVSKNCDRQFKQELKRAGIDPVEKLRNVYRVLLTRGMKSTSVLVLDAETRAHVQELLRDERRAVVA